MTTRTRTSASPLESLTALKKEADRRSWFRRKRFIYYGGSGLDSHMLSHFLPVSMILCDDDGDEIRDGIEQRWGARVFSYERYKRVRPGSSDPFDNYFLKDHGDEISAALASGEGAEDACFVAFNTTLDLQEFLFHKGRKFRLLQNPVIVQNYFDYKARLAWRAEQLGIPIPPESSLGFFGSIEYRRLADKYDGAFVVQVPLSAAGHGTDIIRSEEDFRRMVEEKREMLGASFDQTQVKITRFLPGPSFNCTASICNGEIALSPPCIQIVGDPAVTTNPTQYSGSDFSLRGMPPELKRQVLEIMVRVGRWMGNNCYRGNFGVDFLTTVDRQNRPDAVYVSEINARLVGESQYMADFEAMKNIVPLSFFHVAEFLGLDIPPEDIRRYNDAMPEIVGSNIIVCNTRKGIFRSPGVFKAGRYVFRDGKLERRGPALSLSESVESDEFVVTSGVPWEDLVVGHPRYGDINVPMFCLQTRESVVDPDDWRILNPKWRAIATAVRDALGLTPCAPRSLQEH